MSLSDTAIVKTGIFSLQGSVMKELISIKKKRIDRNGIQQSHETAKLSRVVFVKQIFVGLRSE